MEKRKRKKGNILLHIFPDFPPNKMSIFEKQKLKNLATFSPWILEGRQFSYQFFYILGRFYIPVII
jgi:hypothetical protein